MRDKNLADHIYESLRKDILELRIIPGEKLSEVQLAQKFSVSRAPVRDAISRLHQENFLIVKPQVGTMVMPVSLQKARDILQVRILLEPFAARLAVPNLVKEDLESLDFQFLRLGKAEEIGEKKKRLYEADSVLHNLLWERCGNAEIKNILDKYRGEIQRIRLSNAELANRLMPSEKEMREIYKALVARDSVRAGKAVLLHLKNIQKAVEKILKEEKKRSV
jgi:GntR family transcriptional regulator, rspAB operon transcriptional repressor